MKRIAIIGASYLQVPLIVKAREMGLETHVFSWGKDEPGEKLADYFYPISIVEKDAILNKCKEIGVDGVCSIASDLAAITVGYVAAGLSLVCNSEECIINTTNKHAMRSVFEEYGDPSPRSMIVDSQCDCDSLNIDYPIIVKPTDRSGSRGITRLDNTVGLKVAIDEAIAASFEKKALIEEYVFGDEFSVEAVSYKGQHHVIAFTRKFTTGSPSYIETGHIEPAGLSRSLTDRIRALINNVLTHLGVEYGASHSEIKINENGEIRIIEIGARMGGDLIGSDLVPLSTGIDFLKAVLDISLGNEPDLTVHEHNEAAAVRFILNQNDLDDFYKIKEEHPDYIICEKIKAIGSEAVTDSSTRHGRFLMVTDSVNKLLECMPTDSASDRN